MEYIHKLLIGTFFIATFGFGWHPPIFTEHTISTSANSARSVYAADGDMDVLSASSNDDTIIDNKNGICLSYSVRYLLIEF